MISYNSFLKILLINKWKILIMMIKLLIQDYMIILIILFLNHMKIKYKMKDKVFNKIIYWVLLKKFNNNKLKLIQNLYIVIYVVKCFIMIKCY